eukprot:COSAG01_NODE_7731_length_3080_cov_167.349547_1_plen_126_part_10
MPRCEAALAAYRRGEAHAQRRLWASAEVPLALMLPLELIGWLRVRGEIDGGIEHNETWLRFTYSFIFSRSHDLPPAPVCAWRWLSPVWTVAFAGGVRRGQWADGAAGTGGARGGSGGSCIVPPSPS